MQTQEKAKQNGNTGYEFFWQNTLYHATKIKFLFGLAKSKASQQL